MTLFSLKALEFTWSHNSINTDPECSLWPPCSTTSSSL